MSGTQNISFLMAFSAGVLSFISPCVLPLVPAYLAYMSGISLKGSGDIRNITFANSASFILGFSIIFVMLGATATILGSALYGYRDLIRQAGGVIVIVLGVYITGILKLPFLDMERKLQIKHKPAGLIGSFLVGVTFAVGWTPCVGPILASILLMASTAKSVYLGIMLLIFYSLGLGVPFLLSSLAINSFLVYFERVKKYLWLINYISGIFLIIIGVLLFTDYFSILYIIK